MILKNEFFFHLFIFYTHLYFYISSSIIFPFKRISSPYLIGYRSDKNIPNNKIKEIYNSTQFFNDHYTIKMLSLIKIGSPSKNVIVQLELYQDSFLINNFAEVNFDLFNETKNKGYHYNDSISFNNLSIISNNRQTSHTIGEDDLFLYTSINNIKEKKYSCFHKFKFEIKNSNINNSIYNSLSIGLSLDTDNSLTNFIRQLYSNKAISTLMISIEYNLEEITEGYDGFLILGNYPHQLMPEKYREEDYISFYSNQPNTMFITNFFISFDEISSINKDQTKFAFDNKRTVLQLNSDLILGTIEYLDFIENNFFKKYYELNICQKYITKTNFISDFIIISCEINQKLNFGEFPNLNFYIKSENLSFEFTYKDLFMIAENKYFFCVIFETKNLIWHLGKPLLSKYTFVYNGEAKTIGFYKNRKISKDIIDNNNGKTTFEINTGKIIIFCVAFFIFIFLIIFISFRLGKKFNNNRKKFANELDDDNYVYNPNENYKKFEKDINGIKLNEKEKIMELINK